jgi:predicted  nucleic acid-binding Zn-ribbon protein
MGATETDNASVVDSVVRAIQNLTTDANYKLVSDVFTEVMFLKDQNTNLKIAKRELFEEYRSFRNELEDEEKRLRGEKEALEQKVEEKDGQIAELNDTKTQLTEAKASLEAQVVEKDKDLAALNDAKTALEAEKASLEARIAEKESELAELNDAKSKLAEEKAALESTVEEKTKELAALSEEKAALEASLADKTKEAEGLIEEKSKLIDEKTALETTVAEKDTELEGLRTEKNTLTEEKEALESKVSEKEKELADLQEAKTKLESEMAELTEAKAKLETELTDANTKIEANAAEITSLKTTVEERDTELTGVKDDLGKMTATAEEAKARGDGLESELKDMTAKADEKAARVEALEGEVADLTHKVEETTARIGTLEGELKEMTAKADERGTRIETLTGELGGMTATANEAKARVEFLETELGVVTGKAEQLQTDLANTQGVLDTTRQDLEGRNARLAELDSYRVSLRSEPEDTYVQILDTIWTSIAGLVETQFRQDLDQAVLTDESCWANLRQSEYLKHGSGGATIPLPQSNSPAAKQMRVAAVLAVLSRALHRYIFRPVYLTENGAGDEGIVNVLRAIACDAGAAREEHARATLLAMLPDKQRAAAAKRVSSVCREVSWSVQHLLSALQYEAFCSGLETACKLACVQWMRIQLARMKIEPYFGPPFDDYDWQVLPLPGFEGSEEGVHLHGDCDDHEGGAVVDDTDDVVVEIGRPVEDVPLTPPRSGGRVMDQEDQRSSPRPMTDYGDGDSSEVGPDEIMLVVWPSMCALENGELESITQGLVISKDQVRAALDEVRGRGRQRPTTKRARTLSMPGRGVSGSAGKGFLSHGDGDESRDG